MNRIIRVPATILSPPRSTALAAEPTRAIHDNMHAITLKIWHWLEKDGNCKTLTYVEGKGKFKQTGIDADKKVEKEKA